MKNKKMIIGYILVILSAFLFGCMGLITVNIYNQNISKPSAVLLRNMLALPVLAVLALTQNKTLKVPLKALPSISVFAIMGCCVTPLLLFIGYDKIGAGTTTVFHFIYPAVVVLLSMVFLKKKLSLGTGIAVLLCIVGIGLFYDPNSEKGLNLTGCIVALASGITYAIYVVLLSVFKYKEVAGFRLSFYISLICTIVMLVFCLVTNTLTFPTNLLGWGLCILLALVISVGAVVLFQKGTFIIGGERASILSTVEPITGVVTGYLFLHEKMTVEMIIGSVIVVIASILIAVFDARKKEST